MMLTRSLLMSSNYAYLFKSLTIATRYALIRKQFKTSEGDEIRIFDYKMQKEKLFSEMAKAYAMSTANFFCKNLLYENIRRCGKNDFSLLQKIHITLAGYKALFTWYNSKGQLRLLQACGGHGYLDYSGIGPILRDVVPDTILEGENSVLILQVSRALLKAFQWINSGKADRVSEDLAYLKGHDELREWQPDVSDLERREGLIRIFQKITAFCTADAAMFMFTKISEGTDPKSVRKEQSEPK